MPAILHVVRTTSFPDTARAYRVVVDGKTVGKLRPKEKLAVPIDEGTRDIEVRIDWCGCAPVVVEVKKDEELFFECGSNLANWRFLFVLIYIVFLRNDYLWLKEKKSN